MIQIADHGVDLGLRHHGRDVGGLQVRRRDDDAASEAIEIDQGEGGRPLVVRSDQDRAVRKTASRRPENAAVAKIGQRNAKILGCEEAAFEVGGLMQPLTEGSVVVPHLRRIR